MGSLRIDAQVRHVQVDGRVVLLDFRTQDYSVLDPVASAMWGTVVEGRPREAAIAALIEQFEVQPQRLEQDYDAFVRKCLAEKLFDDQAAANAEKPTSLLAVEPFRSWRRGPLALRAWGCLLRTSRLLKRRGFSAAYARFAQLAASEMEGGSAGGDALEQRLNAGVRAFARAENFFLLRRATNDCLPRSLALFGLLRELGVPVEHHIGVQMLPFLAHAWVQCGERVVHDDQRNPQRFTTIARLPP
jgi:hypothetical protein